MAMMDSSAGGWSGQDHPLQPPADDDFQQFLDISSMANLTDGLQFDFQDFHNSNGGNIIPAPHRQQIDTPMGGTEEPDAMSRNEPPAQINHHIAPMTTGAAAYQSIPATMIPPPTSNEAIVDSIDAQIQFLQQQKLQHQQRHLEQQQAAFFAQQRNNMIPPTPQSLELLAGTNHFYAQPSRPDQTPQQGIDYRYQRSKEQQEMSFTPLVSPAVTPLETHFPIDTQFTVPGAYFSPLTSPALHAQNDPNSGFGPASKHSPQHIDLDATSISVSGSSPSDATKKTRKGTARRGKTGIRQSPISKPQRRKTATTPLLNEQVLSELAENAEQNQDRQQQLPVPAIPTSSSSRGGATDSENNDSVSPEALNDVLPSEMPPPPLPKPRSARQSPYLAPENHSRQAIGHASIPGMRSPATPASLMKLSSPSNRASTGRAGSQEPVTSETIETFELPESANFPKGKHLTIEVATPILASSEPSSAKTPLAQPLSSPFFAKPKISASASQSPQLGPGTQSGTPSGSKKTPQLAPRSSRKRSSVSSVQVSPALRPRISPNIKPLLPGGASAEDSASHLLATKSNYQRILEGNTVPGLSYPTELSTNLTSKRTSHKIAEQGRRNRINSALQEIATLLPQQPGKEDGASGKSDADPDGSPDGGDKKDKAGAPGSVPNSKASTVELAIEYIKQLQQQVADANRRAEEAEKRLEMKEMAT